jgi:membrane-associated phospholipid phosphatase
MSELSLKKRLFLLVTVCAIQSLYLPTSLLLKGGIAPKTVLDNFPIWPVWVIPYLLCFPLWTFACLWAVWKMEDRLYRAMINAGFFTISISIAIFVLFPTYVEHVPLTGGDFFTKVLLWVFGAGGNHNALPSGHIYMTTLLVLFYSMWMPRQRLIWIIILLVVSLSTLFTGQHYLLDISGGCLIAWLGYRFGLWRAGLLAGIPKVETAS